jgi:large subunit ribosomal protein L29
MKNKKFLEEIKDLSQENRLVKAKGLSEELMKLRFRKAAGQLEQSHRMKEVRRNLARVQTAITEFKRAN